MQMPLVTAMVKHQRTVLVAAVVTLVMLLTLLGAVPAQAEETQPTTMIETTGTTQAEVAEGRAPSGLPRPNSGVAPASPTERGGWGQLSVFVGMLLAVATVVFLAWYQSRAARANRTKPPAGSS